MAKKVAKKKATKKKAAKKGVRKAVKKAAMPKKTDIPGYDPTRPDESNWKLAAKALKIRPFFNGPGSKPFSCLRAQLVPDPVNRNVTYNDFYLAPECRD
jgi:hypothetical protein